MKLYPILDKPVSFIFQYMLSISWDFQQQQCFFTLLYKTAPWLVGVCSWRDIYRKPKHWSWWSVQVVLVKSIHQM